jgi:flagellar biogenesis protein FliO
MDCRVKRSGMENGAIPRSSGETQSLGAALVSRIRGAFSKVSFERRTRQLKLCETLSLGDKRLLALVECGNRRFLIAATAQNISLLETLGLTDGPDVSDVSIGDGEKSKP